jgi:hypothetical protein
MRSFTFCATLLLAVAFAVAQNSGSQEKMCGLGTYQDSLDLAFKNATSGTGETLVTVQVLPSFEREYALVLKRVGAQVKLLRASFQDQLWHQLGPLRLPRTRQQCLEMALAAKVDTVELSVPPDTMMQLWTKFSNINLDTDTCPRQKGGACAVFTDGTGFVVQTNHGRLLRLTDIGDLKGIRSENTALLDWVYALLRTTKTSQP